MRGTKIDRGQTTQDFAVGIGLFLLAVVFVVAFLPSVLGPVDASNDRQTGQAERIAESVLAESAIGTERVILDGADLESALDDLSHWDDSRSVNATLETLDGEEVIHTGGDTYDGQAAGTWVRIVSTDGDCASGCRLVIRVW